jgi:hypothetical protein
MYRVACGFQANGHGCEDFSFSMDMLAAFFGLTQEHEAEADCLTQIRVLQFMVAGLAEVLS